MLFDLFEKKTKKSMISFAMKILFFANIVTCSEFHPEVGKIQRLAFLNETKKSSPGLDYFHK